MTRRDDAGTREPTPPPTTGRDRTPATSERTVSPGPDESAVAAALAVVALPVVAFGALLRSIHHRVAGCVP